MKTLSEKKKLEIVKNWEYTIDEWNLYSLWRYVNYINEPTTVKQLIKNYVKNNTRKG